MKPTYPRFFQKSLASRNLIQNHEKRDLAIIVIGKRGTMTYTEGKD